MRTLTLLLTAALLASCDNTSTPDNSGGTGGTTPTTPTVPAGYLPAVGATPETGPGPSKVRISPTADDLALVAYTNEFRTKGTIRGIDPTRYSLSNNGTATTKQCLADAQWAPGALQPLSFNGVAHASAVSHARYLQTHGYTIDGNPHLESNQRTGYTGTTITDRFVNTSAAHNAGETSRRVTENASMGSYDNDNLAQDGGRFHDNAAYAVYRWAQSYDHCMNMLDPSHTDMGSSYLNPKPIITDPFNPGINPYDIIGIQVFVKR